MLGQGSQTLPMKKNKVKGLHEMVNNHSTAELGLFVCDYIGLK
jgi:hypothetical protein